MVAVSKIEVEIAEQDPETLKRQQAASDAWACALADMLWNDPKVRERMSAHFQRVVDKMVEVRFGALPPM